MPAQERVRASVDERALDAESRGEIATHATVVSSARVHRVVRKHELQRRRRARERVAQRGHAGVRLRLEHLELHAVGVECEKVDGARR